MTVSDHDQLAEIGHLYASIVSRLAACAHPMIPRMLDDQPIDPGALVELSPLPKPVLSCLPALAESVSPETAPVLQSILRVADQLRWNQTYAADDVSAHFLENYAWGVVGSPEGPVRMNAMQMVLLFLGPQIEYPSHRHGPEEGYYVVAGSGQIKIEDGEWQALMPGSVIHNPPWQLHGIRTGDEPILMVSLFRAKTVPKSVFAATE